MNHETIIVLDFGSQYTQLIARRLRELSVYSEVWPPDSPLEKIRERNPIGIILSGGPKSVSEPGAPTCDPRLYDSGVPVLGICYGMQLMANALGGRVAPAPLARRGRGPSAACRSRCPAPAGRPRTTADRIWARPDPKRSSVRRTE